MDESHVGVGFVRRIVLSGGEGFKGFRRGVAEGVFFTTICCETAILDSGLPLKILLSGLPNKMAEENVPASTRTDAQLVPIKARLPIGKSNLLMDLQKIAFIASADVPSIYIQQFWNTLGKDTKTGVDNFQLDELWFNLNADLLRNALGITPKDSAYPFMPPPAVLPEIFDDGCRKPCQPTTMTGEEVEKKKALKAGKPTKPAPAKQPNHAKKKTSKPTPSKKIRKEKRSDHLVDEKDEKASIGRVVIREPDPRFIQKLLDVEGKGKGGPVTQDASTRPSTQPPDDTSANVVHDTSSLAYSTNDAETAADMEQSNNVTDTDILNIVEERGEEVSNMVALEERTVEFDEGQAGSDP
ncbi:hypothetical protein Tco_1120109, partial [Tanacetum coccineum]